MAKGVQWTAHQKTTIFPLWRGPSKRARFLAEFFYTGCGSGAGIEYAAYEWNPDQTGNLVELFNRSGSIAVGGGAFSEKKSPKVKEVEVFMPDDFARLQPTGKRVSLGYCWHSVVDTYAQPTLCMAETYDLSEDDITFVGTEVNRPDLYVVAKAIEHAQDRELPAVRAYTSSDRIAKEIMKSTPEYIFNLSTTVTHLGSSHELIRLEGFEVREFTLARKRGGWLITAFRY